jgi:hypothetical protein
MKENKFKALVIIGLFVVLLFLSIQISSWYRLIYRMNKSVSIIGIPVCLNYKVYNGGPRVMTCHIGMLGLDGRKYRLNGELVLDCWSDSDKILLLTGILRPLSQSDSAYDAVASIQLRGVVGRTTGICIAK